MQIVGFPMGRLKLLLYFDVLLNTAQYVYNEKYITLWIPFVHHSITRGSDKISETVGL